MNALIEQNLTPNSGIAMCSKAKPSCILYRNSAQSVTVIDLPLSIQQASGLQCSSTDPLEQPFPSTEPLGTKRQKVLSSIPLAERDYHEGLQDLIRNALEEVRGHLRGGGWCLEREHPQVVRNSSLATSEAVSSRGHTTISESTTDSSLVNNKLRPAKDEPDMIPAPPLVLSLLETRVSSMSALRDTIVSNPFASVVRLCSPEDTFVIPSNSTFLSSSIQDGLPAFAASTKVFGPGHGIHTGGFDFILLDPPWPNRSVRNSKAYKTSERQTSDHPFHQTLPLVSACLADGGIIAIWITNKRAIRQLVLQSMYDLGLELYEEWVWLKTTVHGEPVTEIHGLWRKPYEVLLFFHHRSKGQTKQQVLEEYLDVRRRIVIAVPDIHSRKPCIKELVDPSMPQNYRALEIFARNLTAGWWSWGDEVLKFNQES